MAPENDAPKLSGNRLNFIIDQSDGFSHVTHFLVQFDLTDIEDIDGISDEVDAEPSSDDDTFISYKRKKPTKRRYKDEIHARIEHKEIENHERITSSGSEIQLSEAVSVKENEEKKPEAEASLTENSE